MEKQFFDVFPSLKLDKKNQDLFEQVMVEKVSATKRRDFIRVTIVSEYLISKEIIFKVENEIKKQLFASHDVKIKIYEKFKLSGQYTPEKLMDAYRESILLELREYSPVEYNLVKGADVAFEGEKKLLLTIEDTVLAKSKAAEMIHILEKIFNERCGFSVECVIDYKEKKGGKYKEEDDIKIARQVAEITARAGVGAYRDGQGEESSEGESGQNAVVAEGAAVNGQAAEGVNTTGSGKTSGSGTGTMATPGGGVSGTPKSGGSTFVGEKKGFGKGTKGAKGDFKRAVKRSDNPDVIYGRDFEEEAMPIEDIVGEIGEVVIRGKIINFDSREIKNERTILIFDVTDFTDTMTIKLFAHNEQVGELTSSIKKGAFVKLKGITTIDNFDKELTIGSLSGVKKIPDFTTSRSDNSARKRVELHCHTKMSDMDGVSEAKDLVKRAYKWGHPAIAITDHGVVQAFPDANHVWEDLWKE